MAQDFSGQNLQGRSFRDRQDLIGANFSYADIRGVDFTNAMLRGANFSYAYAGLQPYWATVFLVILLGLSALSGSVFAIAGASTGTALISQDPLEILAGGLMIMIVAVFFGVSVRQGLAKALLIGLVAVGMAAIAALAVGRSTLALTLLTAGTAVMGGAGAMAVVAAVTAAGALAAAGAVPIFGAGSGVVAAAGTVVAMTTQATATAASAAAMVAVILVVAVAGLSAYVSWQALAGNQKYALIRAIAVALASQGGTNFQNANLTDADFTQAMLKSTDLRNANITRTCWFQAKKLDLARVGKTYLQNPQVRQLVITGEGHNSNLDRLYLPGINLRGANLVGASFVDTDLRDANLQSANLSRAKLQQTKLDGTDLTGASLVGADIAEWVITNNTKLDRVQRQYIFRQLTKKNTSDHNPLEN